MYDAEYTRKFYNAYGETEWSRLEAKPYGRLQAIIHNDFISRHVRPGDRVLDAGSGPGRFSISLAGLGAKVTVLDISDTQLDLARTKIKEAGMTDRIERFIRADITDLRAFPDASFDTVVCFGGALSYVCERRQKGASELVRITRPGGIIMVSVMSLLGATLNVVVDLDMLNEPSETVSGRPALWPVLETGDLPGFPSSIGIMHAPMHLYTAQELQVLFGQCVVLETAGSNVTIGEYDGQVETIAARPAAWKTLVELEKRINHDSGLVNSGSHIIMAVRK